MRIYLLLTALLLELLASSLDAATAPPNILVVGDSISAAYGINNDRGWVNLLQQRLSAKGYPYIVINASISGDTTASGLARLPGLLRRYQPQIVIIELGGNDGLRGLSLVQMQDNLEHMIRLCDKHGARTLLAGIRLPPNYGTAFNRRFAAVYQNLAQQYHLAFQPHILADVADHAQLMQADGIHPLADGQSGILDNIWVQLKTLLDSP